MDLSGDNGADIALVKIFATMLNDVIDRLNQVPDKNFISFLEMIGVKLMPAHAARTPITFKLAEGTKENVLIPERTQVAAGDVIFETEKNFVATPAKLVEVYSVDVENDAIYRCPGGVISGEALVSFDGKLAYDAKAGENEIYLDNSEGLKEEDQIVIDKSEPSIVTKVAENKITLFRELGKDYTAVTDIEKVKEFELFDEALFEGKNLQEHILYLGDKNLFKLNETANEMAFIILDMNAEFQNQDNFIWEYCLGQDPITNEIIWQKISSVYDVELGKLLVLETNGDVGEAKIGGIISHWIRCKVVNSKISEIHNISIDNINLIVRKENLAPDNAFCNDVPLDLHNLSSTPIYPFGKVPMINDTFYVAFSEAFSKKNSRITIKISGKLEGTKQRDPNGNSDSPQLSWEYWDGNNWAKIPGIVDNNDKNFLFSLNYQDYQITITRFPELAPIKVNGLENLWIRIRLIGGNYGREVKVNGAEGIVTPPIINKFSIYYDYLTEQSDPLDPSIKKLIPYFQKLDQIFISNNQELEKKEFKANSYESFKPFIPLKEDSNTIYLGLDKQLQKGPISLFFSLEEQDWPIDEIPSIKWQYYAGKSKWSRLEVLDETLSLTRTGVIEFVFPKDFKKTSRFGKELYWIKAIYQSNLKQDQNTAGTEPDSDQGQTNSPDLEPCPEVLQIKPTKPYPNITDLKHIIKGIYLNTTWAIQAETIKDEILGSSNGIENQIFYLKRAPLISEEIWINEIKTISEAEKKELIKEGKLETREVKDEKDILIDFWVKWEAAADLFESSSNDRHYEIDRFSGETKFGNGIHGKIPSIGTNNIMANYRTGGGSRGNKTALEVKDLKSSIPYVDKAFNPLDASGGAEIETIESAMERAPQILKNRNRAITAEDFEQITLQSSRKIVRVKCLPNFKSSTEFKPGWVTILVIPQSNGDKPKISLQLKKQVEDYLNEHSSSTATLQVLEPLYLELAIDTVIIANSADILPEVEKEARKKIREFLHPITGGFEGRGWEFGRAPCISDFHALLEKIDGVDYVESLNIKLKDDDNDDVVISDTVNNIEIPSYAVIYSGEHEIGVNISNGGNS